MDLKYFLQTFSVYYLYHKKNPITIQDSTTQFIENNNYKTNPMQI